MQSKRGGRTVVGSGAFIALAATGAMAFGPRSAPADVTVLQPQRAPIGDLDVAAQATAKAVRGAPQPVAPVTPPPGGGTTLPPGAPNPYARSGLGEFSAHCTFSHRATADPIVDRGNPNFWHLHDFFGNTTVNHLSTTDSLMAQATSCTSASDSAAYWIPTLLVNGVPVDPDSVLVYYQVRAPQDPAKLRPFPAGLRIIAGDAMAMAAQSDHIIQWQCVGGTTNSATIPDCGGLPLQLLIEFPDCWDGVSLDSTNHKSHMVYARGKNCPASHPVLVPQLSFRVRYSVSGAGVTLSSDSMSGHQMPGGTTAHGDFINTWNVEAFEQRVADCLRAARVCNDDGIVVR